MEPHPADDAPWTLVDDVGAVADLQPSVVLAGCNRHRHPTITLGRVILCPVRKALAGNERPCEVKVVGTYLEARAAQAFPERHLRRES